ncbi:MAG TPA: HEAT repeat domain-containing protein [Candidatus Tectomicrobia bacterium]
MRCLKDRVGCAGAAEALGRMQDARAVAPLLDSLADPDVEIRACAAEALGRMGELSAVEKLLASMQGVHLQDSWLIGGAVEEALLRIGSISKQAIPVHGASLAIRRQTSLLALVSTIVSALASGR